MRRGRVVLKIKGDGMELIQKQLNAKKMRYRKPLVSGLNAEEMMLALYEMQGEVSEVSYVWENDAETICAALLGDEDDTSELRMQFSDLEANIEAFLEDLENARRTISFKTDGDFDTFFNDFFAAGIQDRQMFGWDSYEQDYCPINFWENKYASEASEKRLEKLTKAHLIWLTGICVKVFMSFQSITVRYASLKAALDVLKESNTEVLRNAQRLNEAYEKLMDEGRDTISGKPEQEFDRVISCMPRDIWLQ